MANALNKLRDAAETFGKNISRAKSVASKAFNTVIVDSCSKNSKKTTSTIRSTTSIDFSQGDIDSTGESLNSAIDGAGMFVVSGSVGGDIAVSRRGDFRIDDQGFVKNAADQYLLGIQLENDGSLPPNSGSVDKLKAVNFANTKGTPVPSSIISIAMNLNSEQESLRGNGINTSLNRTGKNAGKAVDDILFPEKLPESSLVLGDSFSFTSSTTGITKTVTYGGMVLAKKPSIDNPIYGSTDANKAFIFNDPNNGNLQVGASIRISIVGGQTYTFTAIRGAESSKDKTFNTITGLANAINNISSLKAKVDNEGRLYIAPKNADSGLIFDNVGGDLVGALGLTNLDKTSGNNARFNSMSTLRDAVNLNQETYSLKATVSDKDLKITSLLSTAEFNIAANSLGITKINKAVFNPNQTEIGRASIFITAPNHGLNSGEFVKIKGLNNPLVPDSLYVVGEVNANGFTICAMQPDPTLFPVVGAEPVFALAADASWQKVSGQTYVSRAAAVTNAPIGGNIIIELPAGTTAQTDAASENWIIGDVVYILGIGSAAVLGSDITVPNGYYNLVAVGDNAGARTITITPTSCVAAAGVIQPIQAFNVRKISTGAVPALDSRVFVTTGGVDPLTSGVKMYMHNSGYSIDDIISFKDLPDALIIDGIPVNNNTKYKISRVGNDFGAEYVVFQVKDINGDVILATTGDDNTDAKNYVADVNNSYINNSSQLIKYFGLDQEKTTYDRTYDSNNTDKNLSATADGTSNFANNLIYSVPLNVYDSLGSSFPLTLYFAKLNNNEWAVEVTAQKNKDGVYDILNMLTDNGLIR